MKNDLKFCPWREGFCDGANCNRAVCPGPRDWGKDNAPSGAMRKAQGESQEGDPTLREHLRQNFDTLDRALDRSTLEQTSYPRHFYLSRKPKAGEVRLPWNSRTANETAFAWAATLYGLPPGIVAVRIIETIMQRRLDAETALVVSGAIDAWSQNGAPQRREDRPE